mgnify:CR=1 FL=1
MTVIPQRTLIRDFAFFVAGLGVLGVLVFQFWEIFFPFAVSIILAYLLNPLIGKMNIRFGLGRIVSVLLIYVVFFGVVGMGLWIAIPILIKEVALIQSNLPTYASYITEASKSLLSHIQVMFPAMPIRDFDAMSLLGSKSEGMMENTLKNVPILLKTIGNVLMNMVLIPFITFFLLKDGSFLKRKLYELIPNQYYEFYRNLAYRMDKQLGNYIRGQALDALFMGILSAVGLYVIGVKYFIIIGMIAGIANLVPYFGPIMGMIPAIFVSIIDKGFDPHFILMIVVMFVIVQLIDNLLINPVVVGNSVELHPLVVMLAIMLGGAIGGIFVMLLVVPFVSVLRIVLIEIFEEVNYRKLLRLQKSE